MWYKINREKNVGWRIDYFIVSNDIKGQIKEAEIYPEVMGSDHCPIGLEIEVGSLPLPTSLF